MHRWTEGVGAEIISGATVRGKLLHGEGRRERFVLPAETDGNLGLEAVRKTVKWLSDAGAPFLPEFQAIAADAGEPDDVLVLDATCAPALTFSASTLAWAGAFALVAGHMTTPEGLCPPIDRRRVQWREERYAEWRSTEVARIKQAHETALEAANARREQLRQAALERRPRERRALMAIGTYGLTVLGWWYLLVGIGVLVHDSTYGTRRVDPAWGWISLIVLAIVPALFLRGRLFNALRAGVATFRPLVDPLIDGPELPALPPPEPPVTWLAPIGGPPRDLTGREDDRAAAAVPRPGHRMTVEPGRRAIVNDTAQVGSPRATTIARARQ